MFSLHRSHFLTFNIFFPHLNCSKCVCVCVRACAWFFVSVRERERERKRELSRWVWHKVDVSDGFIFTKLDACLPECGIVMCACLFEYVCVCVFVCVSVCVCVCVCVFWYVSDEEKERSKGSWCHWQKTRKNYSTYSTEKKFS